MQQMHGLHGDGPAHKQPAPCFGRVGCAVVNGRIYAARECYGRLDSMKQRDVAFVNEQPLT